MGRYDRGIRILVIDPDEAFRTELRSLPQLGVEVIFFDPGNVVELASHLTDRDVVVVSVDCPAGLALVADLCRRPATPPVIAIGGAGFENKSLEHVLILAELRGAAATLPKPIEAAELVMVATQVRQARPVAEAVLAQQTSDRLLSDA